MDSFTFELTREEVLDLYLVLVEQDGTAPDDRGNDFLQRLTTQCRQALIAPARKDGHGKGQG